MFNKKKENKKVKTTGREQEPRLKCPRCEVLMKKLKKGEVILDICESCGGMWFDRDEVKKLAALHPRNKK